MLKIFACGADQWLTPSICSPKDLTQKPSAISWLEEGGMFPMKESKRNFRVDALLTGTQFCEMSKNVSTQHNLIENIL